MKLLNNKGPKNTGQNKNGLLIFPVIMVLLGGCIDSSDKKPEPVAPSVVESKVDPVVTMNQGWSKDQALDFYNTSQGSQLLPYSWFLALEQADNNALFRDNKNMQHYGYIPQVALAGRNPDALPIGFVKDDVQDEFLSSALASARLAAGSKTSHMGYNEWLGLTCAACHTSEISFDKQTLRIDGGPSLGDMQTLLKDLSKAIASTSSDDAKLSRFSKNVLAQGGYNEKEKQVLKTQLEAYNVWLNSYININYGGLTTPYGYGRLDAFGAILNRVTSSLLELPGNGTPANAPVSFPFLWNASQLQWVQWNGSASNHIGRNVGEVSGVFAHTILKTNKEDERFYSSAKIVNLDNLEQLMAQLDSPKWGPPLPAIDTVKAEKGKLLFDKNCLSCHGVRDDNGNFPMTAANAVGKQFIEIHMTPLKEIATDPLMAMNFINPAFNVDPGQMRPFIDEQYRDAAKVPRASVVTAVGKNIIAKQLAAFKPPLDQQQLLELAGYHLPDENPPNLIAYRSRPLNGIWATAPYMHNGSVVNLYQTLLPDSERETSFYVGSKKFDPVNVGFESSHDDNHFLFKTVDEQGKPLDGNSNTGHSGNTFTKTLDENGVWRDFSDVERYQLIEYMKTL